VLAFDLVRKAIMWSVNLKTGIDSGAVSTDGRLYMPDGELSSDGNWYIISTRNGRVLGKIATPGTGPHDGVMSADGRILQLGDRNHSRLLIYDTRAHKLVGETAQLVGGVRPNTIDGSNSVSFTTATGFDGFQVSSITRPGRPVLFTEKFASCSGPFSTCSHGISCLQTTDSSTSSTPSTKRFKPGTCVASHKESRRRISQPFPWAGLKEKRRGVPTTAGATAGCSIRSTGAMYSPATREM
jgi:hypothetical protein